MSEVERLFAGAAMMVVGTIGLGVSNEHEDRRIRALGIAWAVFWWLPPLGRLWWIHVAGI